MNTARDVLRGQWRASQQSEPTLGVPRGTEPGLANEIYREPVNAAWQEAWKVTEDLLILMRDEVAAKRARFLVVTLSNGIQVHPDPAIRHEFTKALDIDNLFYPDLRLQNIGERRDIPMLILAPILQQHAMQHDLYLHGFNETLGFGHWNETGHAVAGELIAQRLCSQLIAQ